VLAAAACSSDDEGQIEVMEAPESGGGFLVGEDDAPPVPGNEDPGAQCLGETHEAEKIAVDMFVMLDISGSMLEALPTLQLIGTTTKWDAVRQSLEAFVQAPETADIGIGLQYFPQDNEGVPLSCAATEDCNGFGPCTNSVCIVNDELDIGDGSPPIPFVRYSDADQFCSADADCAGADESCRTIIGACVYPPGTFDDIAGGRFVNMATDPLAAPVPALCSGGADCQALSPARCEEIGVCSLQAFRCTPSVGCPAGAGECVPFPYSCLNQTSCDEARYSAPAVAISDSPTRSAEVVASLRAQVPLGQTPTGPALAGALEQARSWAEQNPDRQVVTVLATDGFPTVCEPLEIPDIATVASDAASGARSVRTFVIGVFSNEDLGSDGQRRLDTIALAGGTDRAFVINTSGNVAGDFLDALNVIRNSAVGCDFQLDGSGELNFDRVNLQVTDANGSSTGLVNVGDVTACGSDDGWYYVRDAAGTPLQITVCPSTCSRFRQEEGVRADLQIGCATRIR
jgi:hypothetical protein